MAYSGRPSAALSQPQQASACLSQMIARCTVSTALPPTPARHMHHKSTRPPIYMWSSAAHSTHTVEKRRAGAAAAEGQPGQPKKGMEKGPGAKQDSYSANLGGTSSLLTSAVCCAPVPGDHERMRRVSQLQQNTRAGAGTVFRVPGMARADSGEEADFPQISESIGRRPRGILLGFCPAT